MPGEGAPESIAQSEEQAEDSAINGFCGTYDSLGPVVGVVALLGLGSIIVSVGVREGWWGQRRDSADPVAGRTHSRDWVKDGEAAWLDP